MSGKVNGWRNRATWSVSLWLLNEEALYRRMVDHFRTGRVTRDRVRDFCVDVFGTETPDGHSLEAVHWPEIVAMVRDSR